MLTTVKLYGRIGKRYGREWRLNVSHPAQVIRELDRRRPGFANFLINELKDFDFHVQVGGVPIGEDKLDFPNRGKVVSITPIIQCADTKQILQIVVGVVLVAAGLFTYGTSAFWGAQLILVGSALTLGGVSALLSAAPSTPSGPGRKNSPSYIASGITNTIEQGLPVPVLLGDGITGSAIVSLGAENMDITKGSAKTSDTADSGSTSGGGTQPIVVVRDRPDR